MPRRRGERIKVYVELAGARKYGFSTQEVVHNAHKAALGQTLFAGAAGVFFGANAPKPAKATFSEATGNVSSYCSTNKIATLKATQGWSVSIKSRTRGVKTAGKTKTVYVDMPGGWRYAWNITSAEADLADDLGFVLAGGADADTLIWGVNNPKPPRASRVTAAGSQSTFVAPSQAKMDAAAAAGWTISSPPYAVLA
ncbi:MAG: hypothetical protein ACRC2R_25945 [Xenococcaceae cyanobacterium]